MTKKYNYKITFQGSCAEAVHGLITQKQAHFWKQNFGIKKEDNGLLDAYVHYYSEELALSGLIPEEYLLGFWHDIDDLAHINAPHFNDVDMDVQNLDDELIETFGIETICQSYRKSGVAVNCRKDADKDDKVHFYSWSSEKGSFDVENEDDYNENYSVSLDEPFDIKKLTTYVEAIDDDEFIKKISYDGEYLELIAVESRGKSTGTYFDEDTMVENYPVLILDELTKCKVTAICSGASETFEELNKMSITQLKEISDYGM